MVHLRRFSKRARERGTSPGVCRVPEHSGGNESERTFEGLTQDSLYGDKDFSSQRGLSFLWVERCSEEHCAGLDKSQRDRARWSEVEWFSFAWDSISGYGNLSVKLGQSWPLYEKGGF